MSKEKIDLTGYTNWNSWSNSAIVWDTYGYSLRNCNMPEWCTSEFIKQSKTFAKNLVEPKFELWVETFSNGEITHNGNRAGAHWITYDSANKIIIWENTVYGCSSERTAENYVQREHFRHVELMGGEYEAMITYKNTGIPCLPNWNKNTSDGIGWQNGEPYKVPRVREVTIKYKCALCGKEISYEEINRNDNLCDNCKK